MTTESSYDIEGMCEECGEMVTIFLDPDYSPVDEWVKSADNTYIVFDCPYCGVENTFIW